MIDVKEETNIYFSNFEQLEKDLGLSGRPSLHRIRSAAIARFAELGFPTPRHEDWRFTSVAPLAKIPFKLAGEEERNGLTDERLNRAAFQLDGCTRLVFANGQYVPELSSLRALPNGVIVDSLAAVLDTHPEAVEP